MFSMKHRGWIALSGLIWFAIGASLLSKGLRLLSEATVQPTSLCHRMAATFGTPQKAATFLIALAVFIGYLKGRFVLIKTVRRVVSHIAALPLPIRFTNAYRRSYWILLASMFTLGITFRFLPLPIDIRGAIDIAIGSALIQGALLYFRSIYDIRFPAKSP